MRTSQVQPPAPSLEEQLLEAAKDNKVEKLEYVLSYGTVNLSVTDPDSGATALHFACKNTDPQIVKLLLENGLNINATDKIHNTPLHLAALIGHKEIVTLLLDNGADLTIKNTKNETAENLASTDEIRRLIRARASLRQFQQEQLGMKTASASQAVTPQVDEDRQLAEQLQQREFLSESLVRYPSASSLFTVASAVSAAFPTASIITNSSITQENGAERITESHVRTRFAEMQTLYTNKNYPEATSLIKALLKFCDKQKDKKTYQEIEYECFTTLGDIYFAKDSSNKDLQDYPKAAALYQYARRMTVLGQSPEKETTLTLIDSKLAEIEESFVKSAAISRVNHKCDLSLMGSHKKSLEDFRLSLKPRLDQIKEWGVENNEFNEDKLYERAKVVEAIYSDIRNFFIGHEEANKGLLVRLIEKAKTILGPVPYDADYAIIGLGSMALGTMTPWSDVEFAILIQDGLKQTEKQEVKDYFHKLTTLLHINIINLGETELAAMAIKELNDFTGEIHDDWFWDKMMPDGVSFDAQRPIGCKTPLGRSGFTGHKDYDLICTPEELVKYQDEWAEREPTLQQLLLNTVFIEGNNKLLQEDIGSSILDSRHNLLEEYNQLIKQKLEQKEMSGLSCIRQRSVEILLKDTAAYDPFKTIQDEEGKLFDVKKEIYRYPDRTLVALNSYLGIYNLSQWVSLRALITNKTCTVDDQTRKNLLIAFSIACELRLRTYCGGVRRHGQFSAFQSSYIDPVKQMETELASYFKLINTGILKASFYITIMLETEISYYLSKLQSSGSTTAISNQNILYLTKINLERVDDRIKGLVSMRLMDYEEATRYLENAKNTQEKIYKKMQQERNNLLDTAKQASNQSDKDNLTGNYRKPIIEELEKVIKNARCKFANIVNELGNAYSNLCNYKYAIEYYEQAKVIFKEELDEQNAQIATVLSNLGVACSNLGYHEKAIQYFRQAIAIDEKNFSKQYLLAKTFNNLGAAYNNINKHDQAIKYYDQAKSIYEKNSGTNSTDLAMTLNNLGATYKYLTEYDQAIKYYKQARAIYREKFGLEHPKVAMTLNNLGETYNDLADYKQAIKYYKQAIVIYEKIFDQEHPDLAMTFNNIGEVYRLQGDYEQAIQYYKRAKIIFKKKLGSKHSYVIAAINNLGGAYSNLADYSQAIKYYEKAKDSYEKKFGQEHSNVAMALNNLGIVYSNCGDYDNAIEHYKRAKAIYEKELGAKHVEVAATLRNLAIAYNATGNCELAIKYHEQALAIYKKTFGTEHPQIATTLNGLGAAYNKQENCESAIEYYEQAKIIYEKKLGLEHPQVAATLAHLGEAYYKKENYNKAVEYYDLALTIQEKVLQKHPDTASTLHNLGEVYHACGEYLQQLAYQERALTIKESVFGKTHVNVAVTLNRIGNAYKGLSDFNKQIEYQERALKIFEEVLGKDHFNSETALVDLIYGYFNFASQSMARGNTSLAIEYQEKTNDLIKQRIEKINTLISSTLILQTRSIKHMLSCYYHISAKEELRNNNFAKYNDRLLQAKKSFIEALVLKSLEPIKAALHAEYTMFLFMNHNENNKIEYGEIIKYLMNVQELKHDGSNLGYDKSESLVVIAPLQELLANDNQNIEIRPCDLANYLKIKIHLIHQNYVEARAAYVQFKQSLQEESQNEVGVYLLSYAARELEDERYE